VKQSDVISLHAPLLPATHHLINAERLALMKPGVMLLNTSRGALIDTKALLEALKTGHVGAAGLDVYEEESDYFFEDHSAAVISDDLLARLLTFNNVLVTSHQGFLTHEALANIATTTLENIRTFMSRVGAERLRNQVTA
jgi:D-lactate dehydrogenase